MRYLKIMTAVLFLAISLVSISQVRADYDDDHYWYRGDNAPNIEVWTNKGFNSTYYFGEDVAVYFRTDQDCYVVVYDIDPAGQVHVLFPTSMEGSTYVRGGDVYRIPGTDEDFRLEVADNSGTDRIYAVASYDYMNPPDFMRYIAYDYGDSRYYSDDYFVINVRGDLDDFVDHINARIASGPYTAAYTKFRVDDNYRHHSHYRYWDYDPYYVSSVWVGCDFPGSEVWIDGIYYGIAPILVPRVVVGYHWIWVYYGGYPCYQDYFYVPRYRRYDFNIHVDYRYKDWRYRRERFNGWVFEQKPVRNDSHFLKEARQLQEKSIRTRSLPPRVIGDYVDKGVVSRDAPIAKNIRTDRQTNRDTGTRIIRPNSGREDQKAINDRERKIKMDRERSYAPGREKLPVQDKGREVIIDRGRDSGGREVIKHDNGTSDKPSRPGRHSEGRSIERKDGKFQKDDMTITPVIPHNPDRGNGNSGESRKIEQRDNNRSAERKSVDNPRKPSNNSDSYDASKKVQKEEVRKSESRQQDNNSYRKSENSGKGDEKSSRGNDRSSGKSNGAREGRGRNK